MRGRTFIAFVLSLSACGLAMGQVVVDMPAPPKQAGASAAEPGAEGVRAGDASLAGYLGRANPYAVYGRFPGYARSWYGRTTPYYGFGYGCFPFYYPFVFIGHGHHHHHGGHGHGFGHFRGGSGGIHGHFTRHGSKLSVNFRFPAQAVSPQSVDPRP